jgi:hypothetical protein
MGALHPVNPTTGVPINVNSYTATQVAAAALENRQGDNELVSLALVPAPVGNRELEYMLAVGSLSNTKRY